MRSTPDFSLLTEQLATVTDVRHLDMVFVRNGNEQVLVSSQPQGQTIAPGWFAALVEPESRALELALPGPANERLVIRTNPSDEIAEVWNESKRFLGILLLVLVVINAVLVFIITRWFRPVHKIVASIEDVERGDFNSEHTPTSLPELRIIADKLNHMSAVLRASKTENDRLNQRSLEIQEEERRHLAQELHDEMGQSISAIKAIAFTLAQDSSFTDSHTREGAVQIEQIAGTMRDHVRGMMSRLRPAILDELGLEPALQQMVDDWNRHHAETFCAMKLGGKIDLLHPQQQIHLYRIVQEALTNVARHALASEVSVILSVDNEVELRVKDNGSGFAAKSRPDGMGLRGMRERSMVLGGELDITSGSGGTQITLRFPAGQTTGTLNKRKYASCWSTTTQ
jgi:two-component system sensor histidine kinase UhpB